MKEKKEVNEAYHSTIRTRENKIIHFIKQVVAQHYGIDTANYKNKIRTREVVILKQTAAYFMKKYIRDITYMRIGQQFNNLDHATMLYAIRKLTELMEYNKNIKADVEAIDIKVKIFVDSLLLKDSINTNIINFDEVVLLDVTKTKKVLLSGFSEYEVQAYADFFKALDYKKYENTGMYLYDEPENN